MNVQERFLDLKERWKQADEAGRKLIDEETDCFFDSLSDEEKAQIHEAVSSDFEKMHHGIEACKELKQRIDMRKQMEDVLPFICVSGVARNYFGKSASWMHQRINGNEVHGKQAAFTNDELKILADSFSDLSDRLSALARSIHRSL